MGVWACGLFVESPTANPPVRLPAGIAGGVIPVDSWPMRHTDQNIERRGTRLLHLILVVSLTAIGAVFLLLVLKLLGPQLAPGPTTDIIAFALAGMAITTVAFAGLFARPRVPERRAGQSALQVWTPETRAPAMLLWILLEGGGTVAMVGYLLTGHVVPLAVYCIALLALIWYSPGRLAGD